MWIEPSVRASASHCAHCVYIHSALDALVNYHGAPRDAVDLCVIDDRPELFQEDAAVLRAWNPRFIWADPEHGLSDTDTYYTRLREWVERTKS